MSKFAVHLMIAATLLAASAGVCRRAEACSPPYGPSFSWLPNGNTIPANVGGVELQIVRAGDADMTEAPTFTLVEIDGNTETPLEVSVNEFAADRYRIIPTGGFAADREYRASVDACPEAVPEHQRDNWCRSNHVFATGSERAIPEDLGDTYFDEPEYIESTNTCSKGSRKVTYHAGLSDEAKPWDGAMVYELRGLDPDDFPVALAASGPSRSIYKWECNEVWSVTYAYFVGRIVGTDTEIPATSADDYPECPGPATDGSDSDNTSNPDLDLGDDLNTDRDSSDSASCSAVAGGAPGQAWFALLMGLMLWRRRR